ncbi:hypothetical protein EOE18_15300 [Novosphingobium umbonatum]|uniref:DUF2833 domain-containing protein n=1 Tax=Novosphingobium umbonatum TaxID=1908524 RepID=A0A3S2Y6Q4_9SPHN|nr:hypothetical protein [Novosphingobium umbonatum]RVU03487.1 hypothetical protein EOE18_15300 [Novosphingobium umbonatum]
MIQFKNIREVPEVQLIGWLKVLADNLRAADKAEIEATHGLDPLGSLIKSADLSTLCWVALDGDVPFCIFGCAPSVAPQVGIAWLMGTDRLDDIPHTFVRNTLRHLRQMHSLYPCLFNYIDARNDRSMRWLTTCGFSILQAIPEHGREKRPFILFARLDNRHV